MATTTLLFDLNMATGLGLLFTSIIFMTFIIFLLYIIMPIKEK